jgi:uncharacterized protein (DUF4415 family)
MVLASPPTAVSDPDLSTAAPPPDGSPGSTEPGSIEPASTELASDGPASDGPAADAACAAEAEPNNPDVPAPPPALEITPEQLEAQDELRWNGRLLSELTDVELAAAAEGMAAMAPPPDLPEIHNQRNWLKLRVTWPQRRVPLHLRVDEVVMEWFRRDGMGYQGRMNAVLRAYVEAQLEAEGRRR